MTTQELRNEVARLDNLMDYLEDRQGYVPREMKNHYWNLRNRLEEEEKGKKVD